MMIKYAMPKLKAEASAKKDSWKQEMKIYQGIMLIQNVQNK